METRLISKTISQFRFGKPFNTGAVQGWGASADFAPAARLPFFEYSERDSEIILRHDLETDACVWGMGQNLGSLNRRGRRYSLLCRDQPAHTPDKLGLYGSHPFLVVEDSRGCLGVFVD